MAEVVVVGVLADQPVRHELLERGDVSSSPRPLVAGTVSTSNDRPSTEAAASTCRPVSLAASFGEPDASVDTQVVCVDRRRQWSKWRNVWHSSAIRSTLYTMGAPVRGVKRLFA